MPLIDRSGFIADPWHHIDADEPAPADADEVRILVPFRRLREFRNRARIAPLGVRIDNDTPPEVIAPVLDELALVAIGFPNAADGRGFSLARCIRTAGFSGELRASGTLIADQFAFAMACGFDTIEIPEDLAERQPESHWRMALEAISISFQAGYDTAQPALQARHAQHG